MNTYRVELRIGFEGKVQLCNVVASCIEDAEHIAVRTHGGLVFASRKLFAGSPAD